MAALIVVVGGGGGETRVVEDLEGSRDFSRLVEKLAMVAYVAVKKGKMSVYSMRALLSSLGFNAEEKNGRLVVDLSSTRLFMVGSEYRKARIEVYTRGQERWVPVASVTLSVPEALYMLFPSGCGGCAATSVLRARNTILEEASPAAAEIPSYPGVYELLEPPPRGWDKAIEEIERDLGDLASLSPGAPPVIADMTAAEEAVEGAREGRRIGGEAYSERLLAGTAVASQDSRIVPTAARRRVSAPAQVAPQKIAFDAGLYVDTPRVLEKLSQLSEYLYDEGYKVVIHRDFDLNPYHAQVCVNHTCFDLIYSPRAAKLEMDVVPATPIGVERGELYLRVKRFLLPYIYERRDLDLDTQAEKLYEALYLAATELI